MSLTPGLAVQILELVPARPRRGLALAEAVLGADTAPARLAGSPAEAQGSPQFLHDLARFVAHGPDAAPEVTLDELLEIRIARLGPEPQRRLLESVAVAGQPIPQATALRAAEVDHDARATVQQLLGMGLLRSLSAADGDRLDAYHERTREVVLAHLDGPALRQRPATASPPHLEQDPPPQDHELLARLFRGAGDLPRARHHAASPPAPPSRPATSTAPPPSSSSPPTSPRPPRPPTSTRRGEPSPAPAEPRRRRVLPGRKDRPDKPAAPVAGHAPPDRPAPPCTCSRPATSRPAAPPSPRASPPPASPPPSASMGGRLAALWRRGQMAVRGLQWTERPPPRAPPIDLARVDLLHAAALGELASDPPAAVNVQAQHLLLALQTGEPRRVAHALVVEASLAAHLGPGGRSRMEVSLAEARRLATVLEDPLLASHADLVETAAASLHADWRLALARAEALHRSRGDDDRGLPWARQVARLQELRALHRLGRWTTLQARLPPLLAPAIDRDDRCAIVWLHALDVWLHLAADDLDAARRSLTTAEVAWPYPPAAGYHAQHLELAEARSAVLLYAGEPARAWRAAQDDAPHLARTGLLQAPALQQVAHDIRGRSALAAWRVAPKDQALRRAALRAADDLQASGARGHADLLRAGAHDPDPAVAYAAGARLLHSAAHSFESQDLAIQLAVTRLRLGDPAALAALGVRDPIRLAAVLAP
jgi:hypothetical protein